MRARSIASTSTDQNKDDLMETGSGHPNYRNGMHAPRLQKQWKARCYAFRAFPPSGVVAFGGPLLGAPDRQVRTSVAAASCRPPLGVERQLGAPVPRHRTGTDWVALRVARSSARTRSQPWRTRHQGDASAAAPPCVGIAPAPHRHRSILSTSSGAIRPARCGTFQPRYGTFGNVPKRPTHAAAAPQWN
jgi:hypothetical protein